MVTEAQKYAALLREVEAEVTGRWGEGRINPTKERIAVLLPSPPPVIDISAGQVNSKRSHAVPSAWRTRWKSSRPTSRPMTPAASSMCAGVLMPTMAQSIIGFCSVTASTSCVMLML